MVLYLSNSACHAASLSGGSVPVTGFHSTIDRPELGQPRRAADQHHGEDQRGDGVEPEPDGAAGVRSRVHALSCLAGNGADHIDAASVSPQIRKHPDVIGRCTIRTRKLIGTHWRCSCW